MTDQHNPPMSTPVDSDTDSPISIVEIEPGVAILFGDHTPPDFDLIPFDQPQAAATRDLVHKLAMTTGIAGLTAQTATSMVSAQGLVRLTPETLLAMQTTTPMVSAGQNLGVLVGESGTISSLIRWTPALDAQAALVAAQGGPLLLFVMVQAQLASISRQIDENIELTREVVQLLRKDKWTTLQAHHETVLNAVAEAQAIGGVSDHIFNRIVGLEMLLRDQRKWFTSSVVEHVAAMDTDMKSRRAYLQKKFGDIIADTHGMLMAEGSWYRWSVLRAAHIARDTANPEENKILLVQHVDTTKREHTQAMNEVQRLINELEKQARIMAELPGGLPIPFLPKGQNAKQAVAMAEAFAQKIAEIRNRIYETPAPLDPDVTVFKQESPEDALRILRWALPDEGPLLALADVNVHRRISENSYLGITPRHLLISSQSAVRKQGSVDRAIDLDDIRYVRFREQTKQGPTLDIITRDEDFRLSFDDWANSGDSLENARRIGNMLSSVMHIPEDEYRVDDLLSARGAGLRELEQTASSAGQETT